MYLIPLCQNCKGFIALLEGWPKSGQSNTLTFQNVIKLALSCELLPAGVFVMSQFCHVNSNTEYIQKRFLQTHCKVYIYWFLFYKSRWILSIPRGGEKIFPERVWLLFVLLGPQGKSVTMYKVLHLLNTPHTYSRYNVIQCYTLFWVLNEWRQSYYVKNFISLNKLVMTTLTN